MEKIIWDESLSVGFKDMDEQHKQITKKWGQIYYWPISDKIFGEKDGDPV